MSVPPFKFTWWVEHGVLLAGPTPASYDINEMAKHLILLKEAGVKAFIDLRHPEDRFEGFPPASYIGLLNTIDYESECNNFPILDQHAPQDPVVENLHNIVQKIDEQIAAGKITYVHCHGGHGRTGMVIACWLVKNKGLTTEQAIERIRELRKEAHRALELFSSPQVAEQVDAIRGYEIWLKEMQ